MPKVVDWFGVLGAERPFEIMLEGDSLGSVLGQLERLLSIKFVPLDAGKHFGVWRDGVPFQYSRGMPHESLLTRLGRFIRRQPPPGPIMRDATTDIHVHRGAQSICPGQDLMFQLEPDDTVVIYDMPLC
jgi:hypothetical protein